MTWNTRHALLFNKTPNNITLIDCFQWWVDSDSPDSQQNNRKSRISRSMSILILQQRNITITSSVVSSAAIHCKHVSSGSNIVIYFCWDSKLSSVPLRLDSYWVLSLFIYLLLHNNNYFGNLPVLVHFN